MNKRGFTLIELMIVIAIIGTLSTISIPRLQKLADKAKEAATIANLHNMRTAITLYFADTDGLWPWVFDEKERWIDGRLYPAFIPRYMEKVPMTTLPVKGHYWNNSNNVEYITEGDIDKITHDYGGWIYQCGTGKFRINCTCYNIAGTQRYCDY